MGTFVSKKRKRKKNYVIQEFLISIFLRCKVISNEMGNRIMFCVDSNIMYSRSKKKKKGNTPIYFNTNYR